MPAKGAPTKGVITPHELLHRTFKKDGEDRDVWDITFRGSDGTALTKQMGNTFSSTVAKIVEEHVGKQLYIEGEFSNTHNGTDKYKITELWSVDGKGEKSTKLYPDEAAKQKQGNRGGGGYKANPEWSFHTPEERAIDRRSYHAQKAEGIAVALAGDVTEAWAKMIEFADAEAKLDAGSAATWMRALMRDLTEEMIESTNKLTEVLHRQSGVEVSGAGSQVVSSGRSAGVRGSDGEAKGRKSQTRSDPSSLPPDTQDDPRPAPASPPPEERVLS